MKHVDTTRIRKGFRPLLESKDVQAAIMILPRGESTSDHPEDEHPRAQQWLYVISGTGKARTNKRTLKLKPGSLLLIQKNEPHQITNTGRRPLTTLNFYSPPAYSHSGNVRPSVKRKTKR